MKVLIYIYVHTINTYDSINTTTLLKKFLTIPEKIIDVFTKWDLNIDEW